MAPRRSFWVVTAREARAHAAILAFVLWGVAVALVARPGPRDLFGTLKGADFVHFYTLGVMAARGDSKALYDGPMLYERQTELVPASAGDEFVPIYPPPTALVFASLAWLSYPWAAAVWAALTIAVYALAVRAAGRWAVAQDPWLLVLGAAAFPPFWNLVLHGQTTAIPLVAFAVAAGALARGRSFLAGAALGLLAIKPQFGLVLAVIALWCGEWRLIAGGLVSLGLQAAATAAVFGPHVWADFADALRGLPDVVHGLEPKPFQLHSIRALTALLPGVLATTAWLFGVAAVTWAAVRAWKSPAPVTARFGAVVFASVLANPHVTVYDATVLALPLLGIGAWIEAGATHQARTRFWALTYWLFPALLLPTAWLIGVQVSVVLLLLIYWRVVQEMTRA